MRLFSGINSLQVVVLCYIIILKSRDVGSKYCLASLSIKECVSPKTVMTQAPRVPDILSLQSIAGQSLPGSLTHRYEE